MTAFVLYRDRWLSLAASLLCTHPCIPLLHGRCRKNPCRQEENIHHTGACGRLKAPKRDDHHGSGHHHAHDSVKGNGIIFVKQGVHCPGQAGDGDQGTHSGGNQHFPGQMPDPVHKGRVKAQRHQQGGKTHPWGDNA